MGSVMNIILVIAVMLIGAIVFVVGHNMTQEMITPLKVELNQSNESVVALEKTEGVLGQLDYIFFAIYMGLVLFLIFSSFMADRHPALIWIGILVMIIAVIVSVPLSNAYQVFMAHMGSSSAFPITHYLMNNLPWLTALTGLICLGIMYAKIRMGGGGATTF